MQIHICIYRYICMELQQQQECCSLRLGLYPTPLSSSQRAWQQLPLVTSRPGQTGLSFLCFKRPRGASVRPPLEPHLAPAGRSRSITQGGSTPCTALDCCLCFITPPGSTWFSATAVFAQELHSLPPNHLLCHGHCAMPVRRDPQLSPAVPAACSPRRRRLVIPLQRNILVPFVTMLVLWAGWAFVFNL